MDRQDTLYDQLKSQMMAVAHFAPQELAQVFSYFEIQTCAKKSHLLEAGSISKKLYFVIEGLVRVYYLREGKEVTTYLACDASFVSSYSSFLNQSPSVESIQCIEDTKVLSITHAHMQVLYQAIPQWQVVGRILAEQNYLCMADRLLKLQMIPAKEKYLRFLETAAPKIIQRTPLIHIASFLGITQESLSRIRKSIS
ncbi:MAG TPA: Crp/Fnr family transcriptional regulator [Cytophagales bacterium]|nr:Crp/Fnr family transcriptional regulator [Cytophagales bacterium]